MGQRIRQRRRELGLTQADLAGAEYTKSFISQLEGGHADPSLDTLRFLGRRLQLGLSTMAGDAVDQRLSMLTGLVAWAEDAARGGRLDAARRAIELVREIAAPGGADLHAAEALLLLADLELRAGQPERAQAALDEAARLPYSPTSRVGARLALTAGRLALRRGDAGAAASWFRRALGGLRRTVRHPDLGVQALLGMAAAATQSGEPRQARRRLQSAVALAKRHGLDAWGARALVRLALVHRLEALSEEAAAALTEAARLLRDADEPRARLEIALARGLLALERGGSPDPVPLLQEARDLAARLGDRRVEFAATVGLARAALASAQLEQASDLSGDVHALAEALDDGVARARADALAGRVLAARGRHAEASYVLAGAIAALRASDFSDELAEAAAAAAESAQDGGDSELADRYLVLAAEARQLGAARWPIELPF
ncbi:MAG: helix-turn-helix transcriptional regulator [Armatimonadota bacterium]|nr:helix-turn-helix transcriptional regulator [Armatimonadota bacterium]